MSDFGSQRGSVVVVPVVASCHCDEEGSEFGEQSETQSGLGGIENDNWASPARVVGLPR